MRHLSFVTRIGVALIAAVALAGTALAATPGLVGTYFNNSTLTPPATLVRVDPTVNFLWLLGSPDPTINNDNFSARWVGTFRVPTTGNYYFQTNSDDGVRLYVNNVLVINAWYPHAVGLLGDVSSPVALTAGVVYPITLEYYESIGTATMQLSWQKPGDLVTSAIPADNGTSGLSSALTTELEYRFEEASWNGTSGEVKDTSQSSGWNGTAASLSATKPTTANATPAVGTIVGTCGYGVFNRANKDYVALPSNFQNLGSSGSFTVTAWIRSTDVSLTGQRIFIDDENGSATSTVGYGLTLGDPGTGKLRFYTRANATPNLDTAAVITSNTWYFVAFSVDFAAKTKRIVVYDTTGATLSTVTATYTEASIGADPGIASIGGETNSASGGMNTSAFGFSGNIDEVRIYPWALSTADLAAVQAIALPCPAIVARTPGGFNAFQTATAAASITGVIHTQVAGGAITPDVVALNATRDAVLPGFYGAVKIELLDASNSTGAVDPTSGCRSTWTPIATNTPTTSTFLTSDLGRKTVAQTEANAWRDVRLRISYPATGTATTQGCSTDDFAIRPNTFASVGATDADWQTAGTARSLANGAASGGAVHKAGQPFRLTATAVNAAGTPATTTNYNGNPGAVVSACAGSGCPTSPGVLTFSGAATSGVLATSTASYAEAGSFGVQLVDSTWSAVDASDGSTAAERNIVSAVVTVGRFVPDHFDLAPLITPVLRTFGSASCAARSFTYAGQPFGWATAPQASVLARNAAGGTTARYAGALWKLTAASLAQTYSPLVGATPGFDSSGILPPALTSNGDGTGVSQAASGDVFKFVRPTTTPLSPFNANIGLVWAVTDATESGVTGNGTIVTGTPLTLSGIAFDAGNAIRYGVLKLSGAYGSELAPLAAPIEAQSWDGLRFATNTADNCTTLATSNATLANYQRNLMACETTLGTSPLVLASGRANLRFSRPGAGNAGSVDATLNLGSTASGQTCTTAGAAATTATAANLGWLQTRSSAAATFDQNPSARISFGQYRSPLVHLRESY